MFVNLFLLIILGFGYCFGANINYELNIFSTCNATQSCVSFGNCTQLYRDYSAGKLTLLEMMHLKCGRNSKFCCEQANLNPSFKKKSTPTTDYLVEEKSITDLLPTNCGKQFNKTFDDYNAMPGEFPFLVGLMLKIDSTNYTIYCSGFIISEKYIISTAECTKYNNYTIQYVWLGLYNLTEHCVNDNENTCNTYLEEIEEIVIHPAYNPPKYSHDIALIRLSNKIHFTNTIQPICLPRNDLQKLDNGVFVGWGIIGMIIIMDLPNKHSMEILDNKNCLNDYYYKPENGYFCGKFSPVVSSCDADIGAPIMYKQDNLMYVYGLITGDISICYNYIHKRRDYNVPEIYPTISIYVPWIIENLKP